jgi:hypothetical protein
MRRFIRATSNCLAVQADSNRIWQAQMGSKPVVQIFLVHSEKQLLVLTDGKLSVSQHPPRICHARTGSGHVVTQASFTLASLFMLFVLVLATQASVRVGSVRIAVGGANHS